MPRPFYYGGQAVIEGVMIRGQRHVSLAVRCPDGRIDLSVQPLAGFYTSKIARIPFLRGVVVLADALVLGTRSLLHSANMAVGEEDEKIPAAAMGLTLAASAALAVGLFFLLPIFAVRPLEPHLGSSLVINLVEGLVRLAVFLLYLCAMNLLPDIRRVFAYHGAEHKVINAFEGGAALEVEAVKAFPKAHVRCGTSFLLAVVVIAVLVFALLGDQAMWARLLSRVVLIPVIVAISYEVNRFGAGHARNPLVKAFLKVGLTLQRLTTREPDGEQLAVALAALKGALEADAVQAALPVEETGTG